MGRRGEYYVNNTIGVINVNNMVNVYIRSIKGYKKEIKISY